MSLFNSTLKFGLSLVTSRPTKKMEKTIKFGLNRNSVRPDGKIGLYSSQFESDISEFFSGETQPMYKLTLDFSILNFIDICTLLNVCSFSQAYLNSRRDNELFFMLPEDRSTLSFLAQWGFKEALECATKKKFENLVINHKNIEEFFVTDCTSYFNVLENIFANEALNNSHKKLLTEKDNIYHKGTCNFFGIKNFHLPKASETDKQKNILHDEVNRWQQNDIRSLIYNVIEKNEHKDYDGYVSSRVIAESISNALSHPQGELFQTVSRFYKPAQTQTGKHEFSLAFWDDGKSMIETLKEAYKEFSDIKAKLREDTIYPKFKVTITPLNGDKIEFDYDSNPVTQEDFVKEHFYKYSSVYKDPYYFLATFLPGVTSKVLIPSPNRGYGLYELFMAVLECFNGKLIARTGDYRLVMTRLEKYKYNVNIKEKSRPFDKCFNGNFISIHLPIVQKAIKRYSD